MQINIWSDVRCPFCYIGKHKFEMALAQFPHKDKVEIIWRSFQLDPSLKTQPGLHTYDYLADIKGLSKEQTARMHEQVEEIGRQVGIEFHFDKAVVANSFNAHRLIQMARAQGLANDAEEHLFRAHFTEGKNIDDQDTLVNIGEAIGLDRQEVAAMLASDLFADKVNDDETLARSLGIRGVPFFILNNKFAVSGAQDPQLFFQALHQAWSDYEKTPASSS